MCVGMCWRSLPGMANEIVSLSWEWIIKSLLYCSFLFGDIRVALHVLVSSVRLCPRVWGFWYDLPLWIFSTLIILLFIAKNFKAIDSLITVTMELINLFSFVFLPLSFYSLPLVAFFILMKQTAKASHVILWGKYFCNPSYGKFIPFRA